MLEETEDRPLTLQERRLLNIQRNQSFLSSLLAETQEEDNSTVTSQRGSSTINVEEELEEHNVVRFQNKEDILNTFLHRAQQISLIYRYLIRFDRTNNNVIPKAPLLLHGGISTGKSSIIEAILTTESVLHVKVDCAVFQTLKQLFTCLQYELSVLMQSNLSVKKKKSMSRQTSIHQYYSLPCHNLLDFSTFIRGIFSTTISNEMNIVIVLDQLHALLDYHDEDAMATLLSMQEICPANVTLVYILHSLSWIRGESHRINSLLDRCISINFPPYSESQIRHIAVSKLTQSLQSAIKSASQNENEEEISDKNLEEYKEVVKKDISDTIAYLCEHSVAIIFTSRRQLKVILCMIHSLWIIIFKDTIYQTYERLLGNYEHTAVEVLTSTKRSPGNKKKASSISITLKTDLSKPSANTIKAILEVMNQRNVINASLQDVAYIRQHLQLDADASSNGIAQKKKALVKDPFSLSTNMIPHRLKYLLIACFLAAHNPKGSDNLTFIGEKSKKRKQQESTGGNAKESLQESMNASNQNSSQGSNKTQSSNRYFSLERLLSIYAQVLNICSNHQTVDAAYGSALLQALIMTLVQRKLVSLSPHWKSTKPTYGSNIPRALADEIAKSIHFPLNDFLVQHYKMPV